MRFTPEKSAFAALIAVVCFVLSAPAAGAEKRDYAWFLEQIMDLDRLPYLEEGVVSRQFSSYHRGSYYDREKKTCVGMDINGDAGHKPTIHYGSKTGEVFEAFGIPADTPRYAFGDLEWVLDPVERNHVFFFPKQNVDTPKTRPPKGIVATIPGPGCIYRIWSADPRGKIRFYFDGSTEPMEFDFKSLFVKGASDPDEKTVANRRNWPFIRPMTFRRSGGQDRLASDCYLPIPFAKSCIVCLSLPSFYQFGYKTFPEDTEVETFHLPLTEREDATLGKVCKAFLERGKDPKPVMPGAETVRRTVELAPGQEEVLADLKGPAVVRAVHAKLDGNERYAHSKVLLTAFFDDEREPCIWCPLVNFFGTGFEPRNYKSYPLGYVDGQGYCYFPMPFRKRGRFVIKNEGKKPATLSYRIVYAPVENLPPETMHFKAKYRREEVSSTFDYPFIECTGKGRFLGASLCIDDAWRSWWGEGDEKIWVDDDVFPSFFGTGSEDYFGDAWGIRKLQETFFACSFNEANADHSWTCCYRWMVPDDVPFTKRLRATIENYSEKIWRTTVVDWDEDYVSVAYWYQMPGGTDFFKPVPVGKRRPWGKVPRPPVVEAEDVLKSELERGARLIDDEKLDYEFSHGFAIDLGDKEAGDELVFSGPDLKLEGPYGIDVHTPRSVDRAASFKLFYGGEEIGASPEAYGRQAVNRAGMLVLPAGTSKLTMRFTSDGRAVFDCFQFSAARQLRDVVEAEKVKVVSHTGAAPVSDVGVAWSCGKQLRLPGTSVGEEIELESRIWPGNWTITVGLQRGPGYGDYEVFVNGKSGGILRGYAEKPSVRDHFKIGAMRGPNGDTRFKFVCTGKDPKSKGYALGIDYIGWKRIVVEDAIEGETADVDEIKHGRRTDQHLGDRFSGGNHLWFHPEKVGASFVWLLDAPADGKYELSVYFTKSWDYAIVKLSLDGQELGEFDTYAPTVVWAGKQRLGLFDLKKGEHRLKFEIVGHSEKSKGILVGVDCVTLIPQKQ